MKVFAAAAVSLLLMMSVTACGSTASKTPGTPVPTAGPTKPATFCSDFSTLDSNYKTMKNDLQNSPTVATFQIDLSNLQAAFKSAESKVTPKVKNDMQGLDGRILTVQHQIAGLQNNPMTTGTTIQQTLTKSLTKMKGTFAALSTLSKCQLT